MEFFSKQFSAYCPSIIHWAALNWCGRHAILLILTLELTLALSNLAETAQLPGPRLPPCKIRAVLHPRLCKIHCVHVERSRQDSLQVTAASVLTGAVLLVSLKYELLSVSSLGNEEKHQDCQAC